MTNRNTNFELFKLPYQDKTKPGKALLIMCFCSEYQKSLIKEVTHVFIDRTFKITPPDFEQVLVLLGRLVKTNVPIAYFLLPNKSQEIYVKAFNMFKQETNATFRSEINYFVDFEIAEINAVKKCFMQSGNSFQLCYFHFTQFTARYFHTSPIICQKPKLYELLTTSPIFCHSLLKKKCSLGLQNKLNDYSNDERKNTEEVEEELNIIQNAFTPQKTKIWKISNQAQ
ncbi:hypothetical protein M9Y10_004112 [Tritrichomonas musculus]|uniref:MULE transposase domain-containing protein n=1 Tax=Tritrichomonas musculus TaxID=1915356 RepID=A0ABR2JSH3_9EUKA